MYTIKKNINKEKHIKSDLFINLLFFMLFSINLIIQLSEKYISIEFIGLPLTIFNLIIMLISIIVSLKHDNGINIKFLLIITILYFTYLVSISINGFKSGLISFFNIPITYFYLFSVLNKYKISIKTIYFFEIIILLWTVLPIILSLVGYKDFYFNPQFQGFASHYNSYSSIAGISVLFILFKGNINRYLRFLIILVILIAIFLSESRSSLLAIVFSIIYYISLKNKISKKKSFFYLLILGLIIFTLFQGLTYFGERAKNKDLSSVKDNMDRIELIDGFYEKWLESPFFGQGKNYYYSSPTFDIGMPAHNFILQTLCDFGFFLLIAYLSMYIYTWKSFNIYYRTYLLYIFIIGIFQPYFFFGSVIGFSLISITLGIVYNNIYLKNKDSL